MLIGMSERGPDSAGFAVYRLPAAGLTVKLTLHPDEGYLRQRLRDGLASALSARVEAECGQAIACSRAMPPEMRSAARWRTGTPRCA